MLVMAPSQQANDVIGALGGAVLAACLAPQLWKLYRTRKAHDISDKFLYLYCFGLALSIVYLYFEGALTGWICLVVELAFAIVTLVFKLYLDHLGPNSPRALRRTKSLRRSESIAGTKLDGAHPVASHVRITVFGSAHGMGPAAVPSGSAAHYLRLDVRLEAPSRVSPPTAAAAEDTKDFDAEAGADPGVALDSLLDLAETALDGQYYGAETIDGENPDMGLLCCRDGYVTAVFSSDSGTLSLDFLAASQASVPSMVAAAKRYCQELVVCYPGTTTVDSQSAINLGGGGGSGRGLA